MRCQTTDVPGRSYRRLRPALAILLWAVLPALAAAEPPPRFYLERVAVEGVRRASPEIIVSESRLETGIAYTEDELRQAVYRVGRLPFVLDAAFSLGRGSERGKYSLLITVEEVRAFFFGTDLSYSARGGALDGVLPDCDGPNDLLTAGTRLFAGQGLFFAAVGNGQDLQIGYERYRLLDRPIWLRLAVAREGCCTATLRELGLDPAAAVWISDDASDRLELTVGVPLAGNHSLRVDASRLETGSATRRPLDGTAAVSARDVEQREIELAWVYDSTDDPVFPSRGDALTAAIGLRWLEADLSPSSLAAGTPAAGTPAAAMSSRRVGLSAFGARHWPLSARQTVSLSLKLVASRSEIQNVPIESPPAEDGPAESGGAPGGGQAGLTFGGGDVDTLEAELGARYSLALWGPAKVRRSGELRWETVAGLIYIETSPAFSPAAQPLWGVSLSTGIALRNTWGIFRIGFTFLDFDGAL
jgi:hypothetical protein